MKTTFTFAGVVAAVLGLAGVAAAQTYVTPTIPITYGGYTGYGYHASTVEEGILNGLGTLAQGIGQANYFNSLASINAQEAYSRFLQNRQQATETYFRMRQTNRAAREAERPQPLSREQYVALAKKALPEGLNEAQYDRTLGRLNWPAVLMGDEFAPERALLDRAFLVRSPGDAGPASAFHGTVHRLAAEMDAKLQSKIDQLTTAQYLAAKKFIIGLSWESQQPLMVRALAAK